MEKKRKQQQEEQQQKILTKAAFKEYLGNEQTFKM